MFRPSELFIKVALLLLKYRVSSYCRDSVTCSLGNFIINLDFVSKKSRQAIDTVVSQVVHVPG